jgi:hypothetical protein
MYIIGAAATGMFGFIYFAMLNTTVPAWIFLGIVLSFIANDLMYGPQAALIAECFTPVCAILAPRSAISFPPSSPVGPRR